MATKTLDTKILSSVMKAVPHVTKLPLNRLSFDYDHEADVLCISLERPQKGTNNQMRDDGILLRYRGKKLGGMTIFEASTR